MRLGREFRQVLLDPRYGDEVATDLVAAGLSVRARRSVLDVLARAVDEGWGQEPLDLLGLAPLERATARAVCEACDVKVHVSTKGPQAVTLRDVRALVCPLCRADLPEPRTAYVPARGPEESAS